ncbi:UvrD-helicase domain-containing protein [Streptomyces albidoflavus]|uniref:UvrD-helicase domain-containing protein n=1 Tax=Streptomyces albidoflavus TaxID=1886 RepID=UPI0010212875|nr:UvrD-helicase domain-containing protein [Streptomyces albidoflavus]RZF02892.1 DNA helicase [Streptomyces albidoflavus]
MAEFKPTPEQQTAIDTFRQGTDMVIQAGAGAGKTSTLKKLAQAMPSKRGLYLAYNSSIKKEAARSFPRSVRCMTSHGIAFQAVGLKYRHRLNSARQSGTHAARLLNITRPLSTGKDRPQLAPAQIASYARETVKRFCYTDATELTTNHVPRRKGYSYDEHQALAAKILPFARRVWDDARDPNGVLRYEHDYYLKEWLLTAPRLTDYDYLLFDEAQDANAAVTRLVLQQTHAKRIAVGDSCQAIYGWRGATDALNVFPGRQLTLSKSFRFGPAVAGEANLWLDLLDAPLRIEGYDQVPSRITPNLTPDAILTRSNAGAMHEAMKQMEAGRKVALVGGGSSMIKLAEASIQLMNGEPCFHPELIAFESWEQLKDYAEQEEDGSDLIPLISLIEEHGAEGVIKAAQALTDPSSADVVVSTAHKSKGLEWDNVRIGADFAERIPREDEKGRRLIKRAEAMLIYVAVTRARLRLDAENVQWVHLLNGVRD